MMRYSVRDKHPTDADLLQVRELGKEKIYVQKCRTWKENGWESPITETTVKHEQTHIRAHNGKV